LFDGFVWFASVGGVGWGLFEWLLEAVLERRVFKRNRVSLVEKVYACILFLAGV
jgi:hypothetical protein